MIAYEQKMERVLDAMGGVYLVDDLLTAIGEDRMQGFVRNNSWAVTQVVNFPRARQLNLIAMVGDLQDVDDLHARILEYAYDNSIGLMSTYGRRGWLKIGAKHGWRLKTRNYLWLREL
jgi:hypothetical protein